MKAKQIASLGLLLSLNMKVSLSMENPSVKENVVEMRSIELESDVENQISQVAERAYLVHTTKKDYMRIKEAVRKFARDFRRFPVMIQEKIMTGMNQFIGGLRKGKPIVDETAPDTSHVVYISQDESD